MPCFFGKRAPSSRVPKFSCSQPNHAGSEFAEKLAAAEVVDLPLVPFR